MCTVSSEYWVRVLGNGCRYCRGKLYSPLWLRKFQTHPFIIPYWPWRLLKRLCFAFRVAWVNGNFLNIYITRRIKSEPLSAQYSAKNSELTRQSAVLVKYVTVYQLWERSLALYGTRRVITVGTTFRPLSLFWWKLIQSTPSSLRSILKLSQSGRRSYQVISSLQVSKFRINFSYLHADCMCRFLRLSAK